MQFDEYHGLGKTKLITIHSWYYLQQYEII